MNHGEYLRSSEPPEQELGPNKFLYAEAESNVQVPEVDMAKQRELILSVTKKILHHLGDGRIQELQQDLKTEGYPLLREVLASPAFPFTPEERQQDPLSIKLFLREFTDARRETLAAVQKTLGRGKL